MPQLNAKAVRGASDEKTAGAGAPGLMQIPPIVVQYGAKVETCISKIWGFYDLLVILF